MNISLVLDLCLIILGLAALWRAGDFVVHYTIKIAQAYNISTFFLGFIVLAITADIPELAIAISSAFQGACEVAIGDIIGANFTDMALVMGITLLFAGNRMSVKRSECKKLFYMLAATAAIMALVFVMGSVNRWQGIALIATYMAAIVWLWKTNTADDVVHQEISQSSQKEREYDRANIVWLVGKLIASFIVVSVASCLTVQRAVSFAMSLHVPLEIIGATILGVGTSLPELALSINALRRGDYALAIGPTLGTVLSQTTLVLGILAILSPKPVSLDGLGWAFWFMFAAFGIIAFALASRRFMGRMTGVALVSLFVTYLSYQACIGL